MRTCSADLPSGYGVMMQDLSRLAHQLHDPAIPTMQWFCADRICPAIIDHTLVTHDGDHLTIEYSTDMAPLIAPEMRRILARL